MKLWPKLLAEFIGTSMLLAVVVGSGIMGSALAGGNNAIALLANAMATAAALYVLIVLFAPVVPPLVTLVMRLRSEITNGEAASYVAVQMVAAVVGVALAHVMFGLPCIQVGTHIRSGVSAWVNRTSGDKASTKTIRPTVSADMIPNAARHSTISPSQVSAGTPRGKRRAFPPVQWPSCSY